MSYNKRLRRKKFNYDTASDMDWFILRELMLLMQFEAHDYLMAILRDNAPCGERTVRIYMPGAADASSVRSEPDD